MPPHVLTQLRYRMQTDRNAVTLLEYRAVDPAEPTGDLFEIPFARLRFFRSKGWELYWSDRNSDFHVYEDIEPTQRVRALLDEFDEDPTCIFFG